MKMSSGAFQNRLLASLPTCLMQRLEASLDPCTLPLGKVLFESGEPVKHVYFPTDAVVSLTHVTVEGDSAEVALVGNEGVVGIARFLGGESSHTRGVVQIAGNAYRVSSRAVIAEFACHTDLIQLVLRYSQSLMTQMGQTAVCNRHHDLPHRLCRLLLRFLDRHPSGELILTHEQLAYMLGVRREGVTVAAVKLQRLGVIAYSRGRIRILNRERLEGLSCECYRVVTCESDRLLPVNRVERIVPQPTEYRAARQVRLSA